MVRNNNFSNSNNSLNFANSLSCITENPLLLLVILGVSGFLIRLYYFPFGLPITLDGQSYFWYAIDMSILGTFPTYYTFPNNGWPSFLSIFFYVLPSENIQDYMDLQRWLTVTISVFTIIPVYLLCTRFFEKKYAIIGAAFFVFEPRMIQYSLLGLTETPFILLGATALFLFLSKHDKAIYTSFAVLGLFALVRYEGLLLVLPLSVLYFVRFKLKKNIILKYLFAITIFLLILLPMAYLRIETTGQDGLVSHVTAGPKYYQYSAQQSDNYQDKILNFIFTGFTNLVKYLGWVSIPVFIFFLPFGIFMIFKNIDHKKTMIILAAVFLLIPAFYAYSRNIQDTKYLYVLYPIFCVLSLYTVKTIEIKFKKRNIFLILIIIGVIFGSLIFLSFKSIDYEREREVLSLAHIINAETSIINSYYPEVQYLIHTKYANLEKFPVLSSTIPERGKIIRDENFDSVEKYILFGENKGLTHLVLDGSNARPPVLNDIFYNEEKYPYLIKIYDSLEHGYKYHMKIFEIDYQLFEKLQTGQFNENQ